jgi:peptidyl-prolyl cis-trans isomerase A (cyclophilin A)
VIRIVILLALTTPLHAELLATMATSRGNVVVDLQYSVAPQAVANFMTLAQGSRSWVDSSTGKIRKVPYYNGLKFHRTANETNVKFAQSGSRKGDSSDGPGYTIKDEFSPSLVHVPYVVSTANAGPNTIGSQFFLTGNVAIPAYDNSYSIFGLVSDPASRTVVDAIITAGANGTTIQNITFQRTDASAAAFNEQAQNLPVVYQPAGKLEVTRGVSTLWRFDTPLGTGNVFQAFRSFTLAETSWLELESAGFHVGIGNPMVNGVVLDNASADKAFYHLTAAQHPGSVAPGSLANRTMLIDLDGDLFYYQFNSSGSGGIALIDPVDGPNTNFTFNTVDAFTGAHNVALVLENIGLLPQFQYFRLRIGCDSANSIQISGRHSLELLSSMFTWFPYTKGPCAITR